MFRKKGLSIQELMRASKINLEDGKTIQAIARELGTNPVTLKKRLQENNIKFRMVVKKRKRSIEKKHRQLTLEEFNKGINSSNDIQAIRDGFKEGMIVQLDIKNKKEFQGHRVTGTVEIKTLYSNFLLVEKRVGNGLIKESISFRDIYTKDVELKSC